MPADRRRGAGTVRIIAGHWRGRKLPVADLPGLRPTPDRVRETVFNWLQPMIEGSRCLDLFAGTGVLGLEAASRGAAAVRLVERDPVAAAALRAHVQRWAADQVQVANEDALGWLRRTQPQPFDLVFLDPPYGDALLVPAFRALVEGGWLAPSAWIYAEWPAGQANPLPLLSWREARVGQVSHALFRLDLQPPSGSAP